MTDEILNPNRPTPIDKEVFWDKTQTIVSKSDLFGTIDYANEAFADVSGYEEYELVGKPHSLIRHPDMPKVLYKILWDNLKLGAPFQMIFKNLAKSGRYYWVISEFEYNKDRDGKVETYISRRNAVSSEVLEAHIIPLYKKLLQIEEASGLKYSEKYMIGFLEEKGLNFTDYILSLVNNGNAPISNATNETKIAEVAVAEKIAEVKKVDETPIAKTVEVKKPETVVEIAKVQEPIKPIEVKEVKPTIEIDQKIVAKDVNPVSEVKNNSQDVAVKQNTDNANNELEDEDFSASDLEQEQREVRSGFIGKLFGRE